MKTEKLSKKHSYLQFRKDFEPNGRHCENCNTLIHNVFLIKCVETKKTYKVGSECVKTLCATKNKQTNLF